VSTLSRRALVTGLVGACCAPRLAHAEGFRPFEAIAVDGAPALDRPYQASLYGAAPAALRRAYADRFGSTSVPGGVRLTVRRYEPASTAGPDGFRASTWVIDYEEANVARLVKRARQKHGDRPDPTALAHFVDRTIGQKNLNRSFDIASAVARRQEGDCTEHAVLLTALLRAAGYPARLALGILFEREENQVGAYGHAWAEAWVDGAWRGVDGTRPGRVVDASYLAGGTLTDESPSYRGHLSEVLGASHPQRIVLGAIAT
jgi:transglutaminase-like putative cysteine protease